MNVLSFLLISNDNYLAHRFILSLLDLGHTIFVFCPDNTEKNSFIEKYGSNIFMIEKHDIKSVIADYQVCLVNSKSDRREDLYLLDFWLREEKSLFISSYIARYDNALLVCESSYDYSKDIETTYDVISELFVDSVISLSRYGRDHLEVSSGYQDNNFIYNLIDKEKKCKEIKNYFDLCSQDENLFHLKSLIFAPDKNKKYSKKSIIIKNIKLNLIDCELLLLSLLYLLNARKDSVFYYCLSSQLMSIKKFINTNYLCNYEDIYSACKNELYANAYALNIKPEKDADIFLDYNSTTDDINDNILLLLHYSSKKNELTISYHESLYFFDDSKKFVDSFLARYEGFFRHQIKFPDLIKIDNWEHNQALDPENYYENKKLSHHLIHSWFEEQVNLTPSNTALVYDGIEFSYSELNQKANQLAHYIIEKFNSDPGFKILLCLYRSEQIIITIIACLKAKGCYIPISPSIPDNRIRKIINDSNPDLIITDSQSYSKFITDGSAPVVNLDVLKSSLGHYSLVNPLSLVDSSSLAYIIYTSGSTGMPKGVMVEHGAAVNTLLAKTQLFNQAEYKKYNNYLWFSDYSFDAHICEIFAAILNGHCLYVLPQEMRYDLEDIAKYIHTNKINIATLTPALLDGKIKLSLNVLLVVGDKANKDILDFYKSQNIAIINAYGPTEAAVCTTMGRYENNPTNIGKAIRNTVVDILDSNLQALPRGVIGELCISGKGLAKGYINDPELTELKFIFRKIGSREKLYRTGDLARFLPCGDIEFIGRIDDQLKIRGFRIELGEIEQVLQKNSLVNQAVVIAVEQLSNQKKLVAYITLSGTYMVKQEKVISILKEMTAQDLPDYMQPAQIIVLDKFKLTHSGKIDKKSLISLEKTLQKNVFQAPKSFLEKKLAKIWKEVLNIQSVSFNDNFFDLGGHSLIATQIVARIRRDLQLEISLKSVFEKPVFSDFSKVLSSLKKQSFSEMKKVARDKTIPLSFAQQRLWFIEQVVKKGVYNIPLAYKLEGKLDVSALKLALNTMVERHEILRTLIITKDNISSQVIKQNATLNLSEIKVDTQEELDSYLNTESYLPFCFDTDFLIRCRLIQFKNDYILLVIFHHIISDGWSLGIWNRELSELYNSYNSNKQLPDLPLQYADYSVWQRNYLSDQFLKKQLDYWNRQLSGIPEEIVFTDKPRPKVPSYEGVALFSSIGEDLSKQLEKFSLEQNTTPFTSAFSAFAVLLHRYSQQKDIIIGTPVANRDYTETENIIGFFVNTLAIRTKFEDQQSFLDVCSQIKETTLEAYSHQSVPFDQLVEHLEIERDLSRNPIFQVEFGLDDILNAQELLFSGIKVSHYHITAVRAPYDLRIGFSKKKGQYYLHINYATDLFYKKSIDDLLKHYKLLLEQLLKNPEQIIDSINYLTNEEQSNLIQWNQNEYEHPKDKFIYELFEQAVNLVPDKIALIYKDQQLSYEELNNRANQLAHYLLAQGVTLETPIGVCIPRCPDLIISLLAILKIGATYVPLDPEYPKERLAFILENCGAPLIITRSDIVESLPSIWSMPIVIDKIDNLISRPQTNPKVTIFADSLSYIIYTSGSRGQPKGVGVSHRSLNHMIWVLEKSHKEAMRQGFIPNVSMCFDPSLWQFILPLICMSRLILCDKKIDNQPEVINSFLKKYNIKIYFSTPAVLEVLLNLEDITQSVESILVGGESFKLGLFIKLKQKMPKAQVYNLYGPTETTHHVTQWHQDNNVTNTIPIGTPIYNTQIHLLDSNLNPVPNGKIGEIYIAGISLARGYVNQPGLTAATFIASPFKDGERLYKTGDFARYLEDGNIEFIGRADDQVKIRGFRIELGDIESVLQQNPLVQQAVVLVQETAQGQKKLIGYVKASKVEGLISSLSELVSKKLPKYMQLAQIVILDDFPLTTNGKYDKKAFPISCIRDDRIEYQAPLGLLENILASIWSEIINIEKVGRNDNFFALGGNSILSIHMASKANEAGIQFSIEDVFEFPTIAALVEYSQNNEKRDSCFVIQKTGTKPPLFIVHPASGLSLAYRRLRHLVKDRPIYGIEDPYYGLEKSGFTDMKEMAVSYANLIQSKYPSGPYNIGGWSFGGLIAIEIVQLLIEKGKKVDSLILFDTFNNPLKIGDNLNDINIMLEEDGWVAKEMRKNCNRNEELLPGYVPSFCDIPMFLFKANQKQNNISEQMFNQKYNGWEKLFPEIKIYSISATHKYLFNDSVIEEVTEYINKSLCFAETSGF